MFPNGLKTISRNKEIQMIVASGDFSGKTGKEIGVGCSKADVASRYGDPTRMLDSTIGYTLIYESAGIAFNFEGEKLVSWILF